MKVTIIGAGSRGDVQPYVALGKGLKDAGHSVCVLATQDFQGLVDAYCLKFFDMGGSMDIVTQSMEDVIEQGNFLRILSSMQLDRVVSKIAASGLAACQSSDLIIAGLGGLYVGLALSEKLGIPFIQAHLTPFTPTGEFPTALLPLPLVQLPSWANRLSHRLGNQMMWQMLRAAVAKARRQVLHIPPAPFWGPVDSLQKQKHAILYGYSPQVVPVPKDWDNFIHVTGYWFLEPPSGWEPPTDLLNFLRAGPPPVYIGFGSMIHSKPEETTGLVVQALASASQRGVFYSGRGDLKKDLPETVFMIGSIPHSWLFPRMAAVVHHGGAGTTASGLWAGIPTIITPFFGDQPFWGQRVYELGVGPRPIPRRRLSADRLAKSIRCAVSNTTMREKAASLGERIRAEDGVARAVAIIEQIGGHN